MKGKVLVQGLVLFACLMMLSAPSALAGPLAGVPCNGNFDGDLDVDAEDVTEFLIHFGRNTYVDPCPPEILGGGIAKTGQTTSYASRDDGDYEIGVEWPNPRFTDFGDGTVMDNLTKLTWTKDASIGSTYNWQEALDVVSSYNGLWYAGYDDWRLPNAREIQSLLDYEQQSPALPIGHPFDEVGGPTDAAYWTSTTSPYNPSDAFVCSVNKDHQLLGRSKTGYAYRVWMVRGPGDPPRFTKNGDGTVTDNDTGLVWLENAFCSTINGGGAGLMWDQALTTVNISLYNGLCGLSDGSSAGDWRLPTKEEWEAFVCTEYEDPAVCRTDGKGKWTEGDPFTNVQSLYYWSSTLDTPGFAWSVNLRYGNMFFIWTDNSYYVWPVRSP